MMSKKQWSAMLCLHISYLLLGASIFYHIESPLEMEKRADERTERFEILSLIRQHYAPSELQPDILDRLSQYCSRTMTNTSESEEPAPVWDFYHSFFFSYTVVSTIGYGNLAPTNTLGRILMIFYGIFGIPINGILFANLGEYFGNTFRGLYTKYKSKNPSSGIDDQFRRFGLLGQITLYLLPGFLFFIFMPACLFVLFEGWDYALAVYYAFVTLTTIGFGDYVAGITDLGYGIYFTFYKIFLIFWITFGLGYLVMVIGFITQGLKSKKMKMLEHMLAQNIKETQSKIWNGVTKDVSYLRRMLNEVSMLRFKPVYHDEVPPPRIHRSSSCPSLTMEREGSETSPRAARRRANSEAFGPRFPELHRIQSETDLLAIDRNKTFEISALMQPAELLAKVVDALGQTLQNDSMHYDEGVHGFSDEEILASERTGSGWSLGGERLYAVPPKKPRGRAASEVKIPRYSRDNLFNNNQLTWTSADSTNRIKMLKARRLGKLSVPNVKLSMTSEPEASNTSGQAKTFIQKLNPFKSQQSKPKIEVSSKKVEEKEMSPAEYLKKTARGRVSYAPTAEQKFKNKNSTGRQSNVSLPPDIDVLEQTTLADLIRALTVLHSSNSDIPKRKLGTASLTPPRIPSTLDLFRPGSSTPRIDRRFSVHPISTPSTERRQSSTPILPPAAARRRYSLHPASTASSSFTPSISPMVSRGANTQKRDFLTPPPPYTAHPDSELPNTGVLNRRRLPTNSSRRFSLLNTPSPRFRRLLLPTSILEGQATGSRTRHESLTEIKIDDSDSK